MKNEITNNELNAKIQKWFDDYLTETQGYIDPQYLYRILMHCQSGVERSIKRIQEYSSLSAMSQQAQNNLQQYKDDLAWYDALRTALKEYFLHYPSPPILPPTAPLIKIGGVIEEVEFTKGMICFDAEVYTTVSDELERKRQRDNIGALVAMSAQMLAGSQPHALINDGELKKQKSLHVKGKVDGKSFAGWVGMTDIRPGDYVEMAAMPDDDGYLIYAIINVTKSTISVTPRCTAGKSPYSLHLRVLFSFVFLLIFFIPGFMGFEFIPMLVVYVVTSLAFSAGMHKQMMDQRGPMFALYAQIADALEFPGGERFQLLQHCGKISKPKRDAGEIQPRKEGEIPAPQSGVTGYSHEYFYYY